MLPAPPQFLNQEPPRAQQLIFPDFAIEPHFEHTKPMAIVVCAGVFLCGHWSNTERTKMLEHLLSRGGLQHAIGIGRTFAGGSTLRPHVINVSVAGTSAVLIPSTARSATTDSSRFRERAAL